MNGTISTATMPAINSANCLEVKVQELLRDVCLHVQQAHRRDRGDECHPSPGITELSPGRSLVVVLGTQRGLKSREYLLCVGQEPAPGNQPHDGKQWPAAVNVAVRFALGKEIHGAAAEQVSSRYSLQHDR